MQALALNKHSQFVFTQHDGNTVSKAFHIQASVHHCFVLITQFKNDANDAESRYHIFFIDTAMQKLYDYELCDNIAAFEAHLFAMLHQKNAQSCFETICQHGYGVVAESTLSLQRLLSLHGLDNIQHNVLNLLNQSAIEVLHRLHLHVVPRLYNWLTEADGEQFNLRRQALLTYPILLVPLLSPIFVETIPALKIEESLADYTGAIVYVTTMIDAGKPIEKVLMKSFDVSELLLAAIKHKRYWEITESSHPFAYMKLKEEIESYALISQY